MDYDLTEDQVLNIVGMIMGGLRHYPEGPEAKDSKDFLFMIKYCCNSGATLHLNLPHIPAN